MGRMFVCQDSRECGMRIKKGEHKGKCSALEYGYEDGKCPFCKPYRDYTNGIYYPHYSLGSKEKSKKKVKYAHIA